MTVVTPHAEDDGGGGMWWELTGPKDAKAQSRVEG